MNNLVDLYLAPSLWTVFDWSLRWGLLIAAVGAWFALRPPRQASARLAVCQLALAAGLLLPLMPRWWGLSSPFERTEPAKIAGDVRAMASVELERGPSPPVVVRPEPRAAAVLNSSIPEPAVTTPVEISVDVPPALGIGRAIVVLVSGAWCIGACFGLIRLGAAAIAVRRLKRTATEIDSQSQNVFDSCRKTMGLRRNVRLREHAEVSAPVFAGGWRCFVLVPADWSRLPQPTQQAILWHELTHARRYDDWAKLGEELIRALFFFHPLVRWLLNRIDTFREEACDAAAVRLGVTGPTLAEILLDFSRRRSTAKRALPARHAALPFLCRRTLKRRIGELLQGQTLTRWARPLLRAELAALAILGGVAAIGFGGFALKAAESDDVLTVALADPPPAAPSSSQATKTGADANAPPTSDVMKRILANWRARQDRMKSFFIAYEEQSVWWPERPKKLAPSAIKRPDMQNESKVWCEGMTHVRGDFKGFQRITRNGLRWDNRFVIDGPVQADLSFEEGPFGAALVTLRRSDARAAATSLNRKLELAFRPLLESKTWRPEQFRVVSEKEVVENIPCVKIQHQSGKDRVTTCLVDPARSDIVIRFELRDRENVVEWVTMEYQRHSSQEWIPTSWSFRDGGLSGQGKVTASSLNQAFPADTFALTFPPQSLVFDYRTNDKYAVAPNGSKANVTVYESRSEVDIAKALDSKVDFPIEPQPLRDALEFIHSRFNIPVIIDERALEAASVDPTTEVKADMPRATLRQMMTVLLQQLPRPLDFSIEDDVLKISTGRGRLLKIPRLSTTKIDSPAARKLEQALEQPVDFVIEPQPLHDAIAFINSRFGVSITIDEKTNSRDVEVKVAVPVIRLRSLLVLLADQLPKPLKYEWEVGGLRMVPIDAKR